MASVILCYLCVQLSVSVQDSEMTCSVLTRTLNPTHSLTPEIRPVNWKPKVVIIIIIILLIPQLLPVGILTDTSRRCRRPLLSATQLPLFQQPP